MKNYPKIIDTSKRKKDGTYVAKNFGLSMAFGEPFMRAGDFCWPKFGCGGVFLRGDAFEDDSRNTWYAEFDELIIDENDIHDYTGPSHWHFYDDDKQEELSYEEFMDRFNK